MIALLHHVPASVGLSVVVVDVKGRRQRAVVGMVWTPSNGTAGGKTKADPLSTQ